LEAEKKYDFISDYDCIGDYNSIDSQLFDIRRRGTCVERGWRGPQIVDEAGDSIRGILNEGAPRVNLKSYQQNDFQRKGESLFLFSTKSKY